MNLLNVNSLLFSYIIRMNLLYESFVIQLHQRNESSQSESFVIQSNHQLHCTFSF